MQYFCTVLFVASVTDCHRARLLDILAELLHVKLTCVSSNLGFIQLSATLSHSFFHFCGVIMQTDKENTKPGGTRVPEFAKELEAQELGPGLFDTEDLEWSKILDRGNFYMVAAIPKHKLEDFVAGEGERGCTNINVAHKSDNRSVGLVTDLVCECKYGCHKGTARKRKAATPLTEAPGRRSKIVMHDSIKKGCKYQFTAKEYHKHEGVLFIKFRADSEDKNGLCLGMQHISDDGCSAHEGLDIHVPHTEEVHSFVSERVKSGVQVKVIQDGNALSSNMS
jgi:hypothetical protein